MKATLVISFGILIIFLFAFSVYGLMLAFKASIILGVISLFVEPSPLLFGLVMVLLNKNIPEMIINFLNK